MSVLGQSVVERLHASNTMAVVAVAGAGSDAVSSLLGVPGASKTVLEILVPYSPRSLVEFLGSKPDQSVNDQTALAMARRAYQRAVRLREDDVAVVGVASTAAIATDRARRGEHRCHVAAWSQNGAITYALRMVKGLRPRPKEEKVVSALVLRALAEAAGVEFDLRIDLDEREHVQVESVRYEDLVDALVAGHVESVLISPDGAMRADARLGGGVLPGSFSPFHEGHRGLAAAAADMLGGPVTFELSVTNVDKPPLGKEEVRKRVAQFAGRWPVVICREPLFSEKARLFPGCHFVIGWDTAVRLVAPRYYGDDELSMLRALDRIRSFGCRFLVAGRFEEGVFRTLNDVPVPRGFEEVLIPIPESVFRCDLTSTELRLAGRSYSLE